MTQNQERGAQSSASGLVIQQRQSLNFRGPGFIQQTSRRLNKTGVGHCVYTTSSSEAMNNEYCCSRTYTPGEVLFSKRSCRSLWEGPIAERHLFLPYNDQTELFISVYPRENPSICRHMSVHRRKMESYFHPSARGGTQLTWLEPCASALKKLP